MQNHGTASAGGGETRRWLHQTSRRTVLTGLAAAYVAYATPALPANRDLKAPFVAVAQFSAQSFSGDWYEVARVLENARDKTQQLKIRCDFDPESGYLRHSIIGANGFDKGKLKPTRGVALEEFEPGRLRLVGERYSPVT